jgi:hypothetical protein
VKWTDCWRKGGGELELGELAAAWSNWKALPCPDAARRAAVRNRRDPAAVGYARLQQQELELNARSRTPGEQLGQNGKFRRCWESIPPDADVAVGRASGVCETITRLEPVTCCIEEFEEEKKQRNIWTRRTGT